MSEDDKNYVYVVWWQYGDKSGMGLVRAFEDQGVADEFAALMVEHGDPSKNYHCDKVQCDAY
jgi:hypothetical protein